MIQLRGAMCYIIFWEEENDWGLLLREMKVRTHEDCTLCLFIYLFIFLICHARVFESVKACDDSGCCGMRSDVKSDDRMYVFDYGDFHI